MERGLAFKECMGRLAGIASELGVDASAETLAPIAEIVVQSMTGVWRRFHTVHHVFQVGGRGDPIEQLAGLFHDVAYLQVDQRIPLNLAFHLAPCVREVPILDVGGGERLRIRDVADCVDHAEFLVVRRLFGIDFGGELPPFAGQNEFLSALVAAKVLAPVFPLPVVVQVVACIEATIPFRVAKEGALDANLVLRARLEGLAQELGLGWGKEQIDAVVRCGVRLANRDVAGFASDDVAVFLDDTWHLIPETNHNLLSSPTYTVRDYRESLQKMSGFLGGLKAEVVFRKFGDEPDEPTYQAWVAACRRNLAIASHYLGAKLVAIAFLEALSLRFAPEVALSTLMGELTPDDAYDTGTLESLLPSLPTADAPTDDIEAAVRSLLEHGRHTDVQYDIRHSPIAALFMRSMGFARMSALRVATNDFFAKLGTTRNSRERRSAAERFLGEFDAPLTARIAAGIAELFERRRRALLQRERAN